MPTPGPVAYQVQSGFFTSLVISTGFAQVTPSSVLLRHPDGAACPCSLPSTICASVSLPRLCVSSSQMVPVLRRRPGRGCRRCCRRRPRRPAVLPQVLPPSVLRFRTQVDVAGVAAAVLAALAEGEQRPLRR